MVLTWFVALPFLLTFLLLTCFLLANLSCCFRVWLSCLLITCLSLTFFLLSCLLPAYLFITCFSSLICCSFAFFSLVWTSLILFVAHVFATHWSCCLPTCLSLTCLISSFPLPFRDFLWICSNFCYPLVSLFCFILILLLFPFLFIIFFHCCRSMAIERPRCLFGAGMKHDTGDLVMLAEVNTRDLDAREW